MDLLHHTYFGIPYAAFKSKDELFTRALRTYRSEVLGGFLACLEADDADADSIRSFFYNLLAQYNPAEKNFGCLMVNTAAELCAHDHQACKEFADYKKYLTDLFYMAIEHAKEKGQLDEHADPASLAAYFFGMVLGLSVYVKCSSDKTAPEEFVEQGLLVFRLKRNKLAESG